MTLDGDLTLSEVRSCPPRTVSPACCCAPEVSPVILTSFSVGPVFFPVCLFSVLSVQDETQVRQSRCSKLVLVVVVEVEGEVVVDIVVVAIVHVVKRGRVIEIIVFVIEIVVELLKY